MPTNKEVPQRTAGPVSETIIHQNEEGKPMNLRGEIIYMAKCAREMERSYSRAFHVPTGTPSIGVHTATALNAVAKATGKQIQRKEGYLLVEAEDIEFIYAAGGGRD